MITFYKMMISASFGVSAFLIVKMLITQWEVYDSIGLVVCGLLIIFLGSLLKREEDKGKEV